jgi:hypothetical protein
MYSRLPAGKKNSTIRGKGEIMSEASLLNDTEALPGACRPDYLVILDQDQSFAGSLSELCECHLYVEAQRLRLLDERAMVANQLLPLQQGELVGISGGRKLSELKRKLEDIDQKIEAARIGLETVGFKIGGNLLGAAARRRDTEIPAEQESCLQSKNENILAYLDAFLSALEHQAKIMGPLLMVTHRGETVPGPPELRIRLEVLSLEQQDYFYTRYEKLIGCDSGIDAKISSLAAESDKLANFLNLDEAGLHEEVKKVLVAAGSQAFGQSAETSDNQ